MPKLAPALTDIKIKNAKPTSKPYKLADGGGMYLLVNTDGSKYWRMDYRFNEKRLTLAFGKYPDVGLADARLKRTEAKTAILSGTDPSDTRKEQKAIAKVKGEINKRIDAGLPAIGSFEAIAWEWFETKIKPLSTSHSTRTAAYLTNDLIPYLGSKLFIDIEPFDLLECLRRIEERKNNQGDQVTETANRVRTLMSGLWRYAIALQKGYANRDIAHDLIGALKTHEPKNFSHITDPKLLGQLMRDIESYRGTPVVMAALRIMPLVFSRPSELRLAKWCDIDLDAKEWRYFVTKTKIDHIVPLANQVITQLKELHPLTGHGTYVFSIRSGDRPMSDGTINQALKGIGYTSDMIQPHGFRHTAATMLAELGWDEAKIERQLSHLVQGVKGVYQKAKYIEDRRKMMQAWADYVEALKVGATIIPIRSNN